ncbi:hypothetical protein JCM12294_40180 [Desulfocicer niacini]
MQNVHNIAYRTYLKIILINIETLFLFDRTIVIVYVNVKYLIYSSVYYFFIYNTPLSR